MNKLTTHCDVCLRTRTETHGWYHVVEYVAPRITDPATSAVTVDRSLVVHELPDSPHHPVGKACCGIECLTKAVHLYTDAVQRERDARERRPA